MARDAKIMSAAYRQYRQDRDDRRRELERREGSQGEQYKNILEQRDNLTRRHDERNRKLSELEAKPARRWEDTIKQILGSLVAALGAFLLGKFGML